VSFNQNTSPTNQRQPNKPSFKKNKMKGLFFLITILLFTNKLEFVKLTDSIKINQKVEQTKTDSLTNSEELRQIDNDFAPGLFVFAVLLFIFILICVGVGIVLTVTVLLILFGLIGAGILSTSVLVGLNKKSFTKGFKTFLLSTSSMGGLLLGVIGFFILNKITHWWSLKIALFAGSLTGILAGLLFGFFAFFVIQKLTTLLKSKLRIN
jgi:hypothetical protein